MKKISFTNGRRAPKPFLTSRRAAFPSFSHRIAPRNAACVPYVRRSTDANKLATGWEGRGGGISQRFITRQFVKVRMCPYWLFNWENISCIMNDWRRFRSSRGTAFVHWPAHGFDLFFVLDISYRVQMSMKELRFTFSILVCSFFPFFFFSFFLFVPAVRIAIQYEKETSKLRTCDSRGDLALHRQATRASENNKLELIH